VPILEAQQARILAQLNIKSDATPITIRHWVDAVTILLAIASILFAAVQFSDSKGLKESTEKILASTTTKYVGNFPDNITKITELIESTCGELDIMADVPGYGMYSNPRAFLEYKNAILSVSASSVAANLNSPKCLGKRLETRARRLVHPKVHLLLFAPEDQEASVRGQFERNSFLSNLKKDADSRRQLEMFVDMNREPLKGVESTTYIQRVQSGQAYDELIQYVVDSQRKHESDFHNQGIEIRYARQPANQLRMWIQDADDAAFSFDHQPEPGGETEISFRTHDGTLLKTFKEIFQARWSDAVCYSDYWQAKAITTKARNMRPCADAK
jgi:hypothetical protein